MAEKRRRSDMNGAIDRLKTLLPQQVRARSGMPPPPAAESLLTLQSIIPTSGDQRSAINESGSPHGSRRPLDTGTWHTPPVGRIFDVHQLGQFEVTYAPRTHKVQNLCAKLITENKRLKLMVPGIKLEDDEAFLTRDDDVAADYDRERRSIGGADQDGEGDENHPAKRQRRNSPGENSDSSGSGREGEGSEGEHSGGKGNGHSSSGSQSGSGDDERDEIVIDPRGDSDDDDDDDAEGRDSDNSNDGLTGKQRMAVVANHSNGNAGDGSVVSAGEPTSFSGLSFPQSSQDVAAAAAQQQPQQHHQFHNHHGASELQQQHQQQQQQQLHHLHHQHGGM